MMKLSPEEIRAMRRSYGEIGLAEGDLQTDPLEQFQLWLVEATANVAIVEANAMVLSTVNEGQPSSRTVLLKNISESGFTFFTNYSSQKALELAANPKVSLLFPWYPMERQVCIQGVAQKVSEQESDNYFAIRPRTSQIGAWASLQSTEIESRQELETKFIEFTEKFGADEVLPRPPYWGGYRIIPTSIEFWQGRNSRLHDRLRFTKVGSVDDLTTWKLRRIQP